MIGLCPKCFEVPTLTNDAYFCKECGAKLTKGDDGSFREAPADPVVTVPDMPGATPGWYAAKISEAEEVAAWLQRVAKAQTAEPFLLDIARRWMMTGHLSDKQWKLVAQKKRKAEAPPLGKQINAAVGTVVKLKTAENSKPGMRIQLDDGNELWYGTTRTILKENDRAIVTGFVAVSADDPHFGFLDKRAIVTKIDETKEGTD